MTDGESTKRFIDECIDVLGPGAVVSASDLGMAYRAHTGIGEISDADVVERLLANWVASRPELRITRRSVGGSTWVEGAQLSMVGSDMVNEGCLVSLGGKTHD